MSREFQTGPESTDGGQRENITSDWDTQGLLNQILKELKIMNLHLSLITDNTIKNQDVE